MKNENIKSTAEPKISEFALMKLGEDIGQNYTSLKRTLIDVRGLDIFILEFSPSMIHNKYTKTVKKFTLKNFLTDETAEKCLGFRKCGWLYLVGESEKCKNNEWNILEKDDDFIKIFIEENNNFYKESIKIKI